MGRILDYLYEEFIHIGSYKKTRGDFVEVFTRMCQNAEIREAIESTDIDYQKRVREEYENIPDFDPHGVVLDPVRFVKKFNSLFKFLASVLFLLCIVANLTIIQLLRQFVIGMSQSTTFLLSGGSTLLGSIVYIYIYSLSRDTELFQQFISELRIGPELLEEIEKDAEAFSVLLWNSSLQNSAFVPMLALLTLIRFTSEGTYYWGLFNLSVSFHIFLKIESRRELIRLIVIVPFCRHIPALRAPILLMYSEGNLLDGNYNNPYKSFSYMWSDEFRE
jgi:hypothetical protein